MLKILHNRPIVKYLLAAVGIIIALYYAWNFYPFGDWLGHTFLPDVAGSAQTLGIICAAILGGLVLLLLFHKEYMKEDTKEYSAASGDKSFMWAFNSFIWFVMGLEFFSGVFRCILLNWNRFSVALFGVSLVGMGLTFIIGKLLHVQVNRPPSLAAKRLREEAGRQAFEDGEKHLKHLTIGQKRQLANADNTPIDDVRDAKAREREDEVDAVEKRRKAEADARRQNEDMYQRMISPPSKASSNGKQSGF